MECSCVYVGDYDEPDIASLLRVQTAHTDRRKI